MSNYEEFKRQWKKMQAYLNTLKSGTNAYTVGMTRGKIASKYEKMENLYYKLSPTNRVNANVNMKKAQKIMYGR